MHLNIKIIEYITRVVNWTELVGSSFLRLEKFGLRFKRVKLEPDLSLKLVPKRNFREPEYMKLSLKPN